jgi:hypothetical protein
MKPPIRFPCATTTMLACAVLLVSIMLWAVVIGYLRPFAVQNEPPAPPPNSARQLATPAALLEPATPPHEASSNSQSPQPDLLVPTTQWPSFESKPLWVWDWNEWESSGRSPKPIPLRPPGLFGRVVSIDNVHDELSIVMVDTGDGQPSWVNVRPATVVQNAAGNQTGLEVGADS